jgi:hypothetical protein
MTCPQPTSADWKILARHGITPDRLTVGGWLDLSGCTGLTALPDRLTVGGWLYMIGCTGLTALPDNLTVSGELNLRNCAGLTALPDNLTVGGSLYLTGCGAARHLLTDDRGYELWAARNSTREWFNAGYRSFSREQAIAHWGGADYPDPARGAQFVAAINSYLEQEGLK